MLRRLDDYIAKHYVKNLWLIKYNGELIYTRYGVRGYKNKGTAIANMIDSIISVLRFTLECDQTIDPNKCSATAELLNVPEEDIKALYPEGKSYEEALSSNELRPYIKNNYFKKLVDNGVIEVLRI